jgi:hypothetical protein
LIDLNEDNGSGRFSGFLLARTTTHEHIATLKSLWATWDQQSQAKKDDLCQTITQLAMKRAGSKPAPSAREKVIADDPFADDLNEVRRARLHFALDKKSGGAGAQGSSSSINCADSL